MPARSVDDHALRPSKVRCPAASQAKPVIVFAVGISPVQESINYWDK